MNCSHDECEPYGSCQLLNLRQRRNEWWFLYRHGMSDDHLVTDPNAWYDGDSETD